MHQACLSASFLFYGARTPAAALGWAQPIPYSAESGRDFMVQGRPRQRWDGRSQSLTLQKAGVILWCKDARGSVGMGAANPLLCRKRV